MSPSFEFVAANRNLATLLDSLSTLGWVSVVNSEQYSGRERTAVLAILIGLTATAFVAGVPVDATNQSEDITVSENDSADGLNFTWEPDIPEPDESVLFEATHSVVQMEDIEEYRWDFVGDGTFELTTDNPETTWTFEEAGYYDVTLEIEDSEDETTEITQTVSVQETEAILQIGSIDGELPEPNGELDFGTVAFEVTETADVETENLEVSLIIQQDDDYGPVFQKSIEDRELQNESDSFSYDVGTLDIDSAYMVIVSADADNAVSDTKQVLVGSDDVEIDRPVAEDQDEIQVFYSSDTAEGTGSISIENDTDLLNQETFSDSPAPVNGSVTVSVDSDDFEAGDTLTATFYMEPSPDQRATDSVVVSEATAEPQEITKCTTITSPGVYQLNQNISTDQTGDGNSCLEITADEVVLDGQGHTVTGEEPIEWRGGNYGIRVSGAEDVTIENVGVHNWDELGTSIYIEDSVSVTLAEITATNNTFGPRTNNVASFRVEDSYVGYNERAGIQLYDSIEATVHDVQAVRNAKSSGWSGIYVRGSSSDIQLDNVGVEQSQNEGDGIRVTSGTSAVRITNSTATSNDGDGIVVESSDVQLKNNTAFDNEWDFHADVDEPIAVHSLNIGASTALETILSFESSDMKLRRNNSPPPNPVAETIGRYVELNETAEPIQLSVEYQSENVEGIDENALSLWRFTDGAWKELPDVTVDTEEQTVWAGITTVGPDSEVFGIFISEPNIVFEYDPPEPEPGEAVTFDASDSFVPDIRIIGYEWEFGDGETSITEVPEIEYTYVEAGSYDVILTAFFDDGGSSQTTQTIGIEEAEVEDDDSPQPRPPAPEPEPEPVPVLQIDEFSDHLSAQNEGYDYGTLEIVLREVTDAQTENLKVSFTLTNTDTGTTVAETVFADRELHGNRETFPFEIGSLDTPANYTVSVVAKAENAETVTETVPFEVAGVPDDAVTATVTHIDGTEPEMGGLAADTYLDGERLHVALYNSCLYAADHEDSEITHLDQGRLVSGTYSDLEQLGADETSTFQINLSVNRSLVEFDPATVSGIAAVTDWTVEDNDDEQFRNITLTVSPVGHHTVIDCGSYDSCIPDLSDWTETATDRHGATVHLTVDSTSAVPANGDTEGSVDSLLGGTFSTDATTIGVPAYNPAGQLSQFIAGPSETVDGEPNEGIYEAFLPSAVLAEWGVERPEQLTVGFQGSEQSFETREAVVGGKTGTVVAVPLIHGAGTITVGVPPLPDATRTIGETGNLTAGEETTVTLDIRFDSPANFTLIESLDSFEDVTLVDDDSAIAVDVVDASESPIANMSRSVRGIPTNETAIQNAADLGDNLTAIRAAYENRTNVTLTFNVTAPFDDERGKQYAFAGGVKFGESFTPFTGNNSANVTEPAPIERTITEPNVTAGEPVPVTVSAMFDEPTDFTIVESFDAFEAVTIVDDDDAVITETTLEHDELIASYNNRENVTLEFNVTPPVDAPISEEYTFDGFVDMLDYRPAIWGTDSITIAQAGEWYGERTLESETIAVGEETTVAVSVTFDEPTDFTIVESFDPFDSVNLTDDDGAIASAVADRDNEVIATYADRREATLEYTVVGSESAPLSGHTFEGIINEGGEETPILGPNALGVSGFAPDVVDENPARVQVSSAPEADETDVDGEIVNFDLDIAVSDDVTINRLSLTPLTDREFDIEFSSSDRMLETTPEPLTLSETEWTLGYLSAQHDIEDGDISELSFTYTVDHGTFERLGVDRNEMSLYRFEEYENGNGVDGRWVAQVTEFIEETEEGLVFETVAPGLSDWAAGAYRPEITITDANVDVTSIQTGETLAVDVRIENQGQADGVYVTELLFDGEPVDEERPTVPSGGQVQITFEEMVEEAGTFQVLVNDVEVETIAVEDPTDAVTEEETDSQGFPIWRLVFGAVLVGSAVLGGLYYRHRSSTAATQEISPKQPPDSAPENPATPEDPSELDTDSSIAPSEPPEEN